MESIGRLIAWLLADGIAYGFGRTLLWLFTFGRYRARKDDFPHVAMLGAITGLPLIALVIRLFGHH